MICKSCEAAGNGAHEMDLCKAFGRDHHWACRICNKTVMVADRLSTADQQIFDHDEKEDLAARMDDDS